MMNYGLQRFRIEKRLKRMGLEHDIIDVHASIDRKLTLGENMRIIGKQAKMLSENQFNESFGRLSGWELMEKAQDTHNKRSQKSIFMDNRLRARETFNPEEFTAKQFKKWRRYPNRYDIENVDTKGSFSFL
jgi:hypothetical protein